MKFIPAVSEASIVKIPLFTERCPAGFPSPAADYTESELDLNEYCIHRRHSTYFVRAIGNSMTDIGLYSGSWIKQNSRGTGILLSRKLRVNLR